MLTLTFQHPTKIVMSFRIFRVVGEHPLQGAACQPTSTKPFIYQGQVNFTLAVSGIQLQGLLISGTSFVEILQLVIDNSQIVVAAIKAGVDADSLFVGFG